MLPSPTIAAYSAIRQYINMSQNIRRQQEGHTGDGPSEGRPSSPDPVLLVRQYEEDERMAKLLQGQSTPAPLHSEELDLYLGEIQGTANRLQDVFGDNAIDMLSESCIMDIRNQDHIVVRQSFHGLTAAGSTGGRIGRDEARFIDEDDFEDDEEDLDEEDLDEVEEEDLDEEESETSEEPEMEVVETPACSHGLRSSELDRLPTRIHSEPSSSKKKQADASLRVCQVCLESYAHRDKLRFLPCFHEFHVRCIDPWLKRNKTCPVCRVKVDVRG